MKSFLSSRTVRAAERVHAILLAAGLVPAVGRREGYTLQAVEAAEPDEPVTILLRFHRQDRHQALRDMRAAWRALSRARGVAMQGYNDVDPEPILLISYAPAPAR